MNSPHLNHLLFSYMSSSFTVLETKTRNKADRIHFHSHSSKN